MLDELEQIQHNLKIIREHLLRKFAGFNITEDISDAPICHRFTLTDPMTYQQYGLKVGWRRFSDRLPNAQCEGRLSVLVKPSSIRRIIIG